MEVRFYHLLRQNELQVLPTMLQVALSRGQKSVIKFSDEAHMAQADDYLWSFAADSFLPHGTARDDAPARHPVYLTTQDENPNNACVLFLCGGAESSMHDQFDLCCEMLDGHNPQALAAARVRWKDYQQKGYDVTYWQQTERGGWEKKA